MLQDAIDLAAVRRVLVIKLRHHGDVLLTSPVFSVLKNHAAHLEIDALVYRDTQEMLTLHPAIQNVFTLERSSRLSWLQRFGQELYHARVKSWFILHGVEAREVGEVGQALGGHLRRSVRG